MDETILVKLAIKLEELLDDKNSEIRWMLTNDDYKEIIYKLRDYLNLIESE